MKVYISNKNGIAVIRLSGVVGREEIVSLIESISDSRGNISGCLVVDFEGVTHINYKAFQYLEKALPSGPRVSFSGLNDYLLDIFSFVSGNREIPIYPDWRKALSFLTAVRGKMAEPVQSIAVK